MGQKNYMIVGIVILIITNFGICLVEILKNITHSMHVGLTSRIF